MNRTESLALGQKTRLDMAEYKRRLKAREIPVARAVIDCPCRIRVRALLRALPRVDRTRSVRLAAEAKVPLHAYVMDPDNALYHRGEPVLTDYQRARLQVVVNGEVK